MRVRFSACGIARPFAAMDPTVDAVEKLTHKPAMFGGAAQTHPDLASRLPADAYWHLVHTLRLTLPPPLADSPEERARRDHAAIARIAALCPADAAEADVAAQFVAASEQWKECLRLAQSPETTREWAAKCRAQAASMMRQANGALRLLLRLQQARGKRDADAAAQSSAAWTEHVALSLMAAALAAPAKPTEAAKPAEFAATPRATPAQTALPAAISPPPAAQAAKPPAPAAQIAMPAAALPSPAAEPDPALLAAAEAYAARYPERAAFMRRTRKLPGGEVVYFDPAETALARVVMDGRTPALLALDAPLRPPPPPAPPARPSAPVQAGLQGSTVQEVRPFPVCRAQPPPV
jgi:hypothetical protein